MFCHNNKAFLFCLSKRCSRSRLKKCGSGSILKVAAPGGSDSATLRKIVFILTFERFSKSGFLAQIH